MYVNIDDDTIYEMLMDRVRFWTDDDDVIALFGDYYGEMVAHKAWDGSPFDVQQIVDNDYINNFEYGTKEDIKNMFPDFNQGNIFAETNGLILYYAH